MNWLEDMETFPTLQRFRLWQGAMLLTFEKGHEGRSYLARYLAVEMNTDIEASGFTYDLFDQGHPAVDLRECSRDFVSFHDQMMYRRRCAWYWREFLGDVISRWGVDALCAALALALVERGCSHGDAQRYREHVFTMGQL